MRGKRKISKNVRIWLCYSFNVPPLKTALFYAAAGGKHRRVKNCLLSEKKKPINLELIAVVNGNRNNIELINQNKAEGKATSAEIVCNSRGEVLNTRKRANEEQSKQVQTEIEQ